MLDRPASRRERDRRHKARRRAGRFTVQIELGADELDWLISARWITPQEADSADRHQTADRQGAAPHADAACSARRAARSPRSARPLASPRRAPLRSS